MTRENGYFEELESETANLPKNWKMKTRSKYNARKVEIDGVMYAYVTKARAGRMLDGREWSEMPR